ncbi:porin [Flocculibacter collagenilyticus]|uniref:porin n=1 Tax=Flocculibacter collagenilyticus TaxID=2744479 RepID=UPI0018F70EB7|nr:porin [Flocculibacter collagenilyticus]
MKTRKSIIAITLASLFAAPVMAQEVQVYGKANVSFQSSDEGEGSFTEIKSNASRLGVKGSYKLSDSLEAVYKYELQVDLSDEANEDNLKSRNQYVGLKGNFGEILLGRNDTVLKQSQGKIDLFGDYEADVKVLWKGENRMGDSLTYKSPKFNHFQIGVTYITEDDPEGDDGVSLALMYGDAKLKKSKIFASIAMDNDVKGYDTVRANIQGKMGDFKLGAIYHTQEPSEGGEDMDGYLLSAAYKVGKATLKGQYQTLEDDDASSVGVDYSLGKKTKVFSWYSTMNLEFKEDKDYFAVGVEHKF